MKNIVITTLCIVIALSIGLSVYAIIKRSKTEVQNPNVTIVTTPLQDDFEKFSK